MTHSDSLILAKLEDTIRKQVGVHYDADDQEYPQFEFFASLQMGSSDLNKTFVYL